MKKILSPAKATLAAAVALALGVPGPANADYISDYPAAVIETINANIGATTANLLTAASEPITCQIKEKAGGPIVNPGVHSGVGVAVFPQDYVSAGAQCFSFQQRTYYMTLRLELQRRVSDTTWVTFDASPTFIQYAIDGVAVIPQQVLRHIYGQIPDPNIGTSGSVHRGKFVLTLSTGQPYEPEYTPLPWTMAPW